MKSFIADPWEIVIIIMGIYTIVRGIMILTTGKLGEREEAGLRGYSAEGIRRYKMLSAGMNIFGGLVVIVFSVIRMFNLIDPNVYRILVLVALVVMVVIYVVIRKSCKNA